MKRLPALTLLSAVLAFTQAMASDCPVKSDGPVISAYSQQSDRSIHCNYVNSVESIFSEIERFSEDDVKVNLFVQSIYDNASFDGGNIIEVPEQLIFRGTYSQEYPVGIMANLSTVAHEYGHALLAKIFGRELSQYPVVKAYDQANLEISKLKIKLNLNPDSIELQQEISEKNKAILANKDFIRYSVISTNYSELYADVVAVYLNNNKNAIMSALYYDEMSDFQFRMIQARSFDTEFTSTHTKYMSEVHGHFALTRNYIGKNLWPESASDKKIMLKKIGDAIVAEVKKLLDEKSEMPEYKVSNKNLIERLKKSEL